MVPTWQGFVFYHGGAAAYLLVSYPRVADRGAGTTSGGALSHLRNFGLKITINFR